MTLSSRPRFAGVFVVLMALFLVSTDRALAQAGEGKPDGDTKESGGGKPTGKGGVKPEGEAAGGGGKVGGGPPPARVRVDAVRLETVERWREVTGELRAVKRATIAAEQDGRVESITIDAGDVVAKGFVIAKQDDELARIEVRRTEANLLVKKATVAARAADLEKARRDQERYEDAYDKSSATESERDDSRTLVAGAEARLQESKADVAVADAELSRARSEQTDMTIMAPFAGTVVRKNTEVGQWLQRGDPVAELVQIDELDAFMDVPEQVLERLFPAAPGSSDGSAESTMSAAAPAPAPVEIIMRVDALGAGKNEVRARVSGMVPAGDALSRLFPIRVRMGNPTGRLRPGMSVTALVPTGVPEQALTVRRDAVLRSETGTFVYFDGGGVAAVAPVVPQYAVADRMVIRSPVLKPGMSVIVEGNERLFPGQPLMIDGAAPPTRP